MSRTLIVGIILAAWLVGVPFVVALIGLLCQWRVSVRVVDEDELRKAGL